MGSNVTPAAFAGVDWSTTKHDVCLVAPSGQVIAEGIFDADAEGLASMADWCERMTGLPAEQIAVGIEVPHGPVVETLMERGFPLWAINPKQLDRFRDRFAPSGAKDDRVDARVIADSLRTDRRAYRELVADDPLTIELRAWSRMYGDRGEDDVTACNRLSAALLRYYPQILKLSHDPGEAWVVALLRKAPTPEAARKLTRKRVADVLSEHRIVRISAEKVLEILRAPALRVAVGTAQAASAQALQNADQSELFRAQRRECLRRLKKLLDEITAQGRGENGKEGRNNEPSDAEIVLSLPGVGPVIGAALLAEASRPLRERDYQMVRALAGTSPVTRRSGALRRPSVVMRHACSGRLRHAIHTAVSAAQLHYPPWRAEYSAQRRRSKSHGHACRAVGDKLLRMAVSMLKTRTLFDATRRRAVETRPACMDSCAETDAEMHAAAQSA